YKQLLELPYYNTFFKTTHPPVAELSKLLVDMTPKQFNQVFYGQSGSDANDTIVRMVRTYWNLKKQPKKKTIISRTNGYHGSTMVAASLGGMNYMHALADLPLPGFVHIRQPYWYGEGGETTPEEFGKLAAKALEDKILELGAENVAAFIGEPIQGAGGVIIPPMSYWPAVQEICKKYDLLLIVDEVICGFGRTGHWFGSEYFGIDSADFMTTAKGITSGYMPLSAVMVSDRVADVLNSAGDFCHGYTYSGHPVSCAVAMENIRIIREEKLVERVHDETGPYLAKRLQELLDHPLVGEVRNVGLMGGIELVKDKKTRKTFEPVGETGTICRDHCFRLGLVMRATRDTMLISPPLTWTKGDIDDFMKLTREALDLTARDVGV
ncbi:MAG TPA: aminotransferase, partial [Terriglobia bacterium]|nr:aminotransferase [Terriglobia bacterium]